GDLRLLVLAPSSVQEMASLTAQAFDLADIYQMPAMLLADGALGQMMEPVDFSAFPKREVPEKTWAACGHKNSREHNIVNSLYIDPQVLENSVKARYERYAQVEANEVQYEEYMTDDAEIVLVAFGITARICKSAVNAARAAGIKVGLLRPITLWPFPKAAISAAADKAKALMSVEMSMGQMVDDVRLAVNGKKPVYFYGRTGGMIPSVEEVEAEIKKLAEAL
ncbi:MAG: 3-methyl-2-oxobutanoate dehydrogenase subunit beta, partial [Clostridia bacterium]|nr:3-methyl-2-oxobutanoate dehydrogenase subunit beta [Clostridia bacterium]